MTISGIKIRLTDIDSIVGPLAQERRHLEKELRHLQALEFIRHNNIELPDIQRSEGKGVPFFNTAWEFGRWCKANSHKNWVEWNTGVYLMSDLANGRMPDPKAYLSDFE